MDIVHFIIYISGWLAVILGCELYRNRNSLDSTYGRKKLGLAMAFMAAFGPLGEIFVGNLYHFLFGQPLWQYQVFPIHEGYTSLIAPYIWAVSGAQFYFSLSVIKRRIRRSWVQYAAMACEILVVELALNISALLVLGTQLFYYLPGDLGHYASLQALPFYYFAAMIIVRSMKNMGDHPRFFIVFCTSVSFVVVYLAQ